MKAYLLDFHLCSKRTKRC